MNSSSCQELVVDIPGLVNDNSYAARVVESLGLVSLDFNIQKDHTVIGPLELLGDQLGKILWELVR